MHDKSKKRSRKLEDRTRKVIVQWFLDGKGSVDDIYRLPFQVRDELLQLYNFQIAMNGIRNDTLSIQEINEILQVDGAVPSIMNRMYYTIPKSQRTEFIKLYWSKGYQSGDIPVGKLYESLDVAEADRIAMDEALRLYQEELDGLVSLYLTDAERRKYSDRDSIIQEAEDDNVRSYNYYLGKLEREMDRWEHGGEARYFVNYLRPFGSLLTEAIFIASVTEKIITARSNMRLGLD